MSDAPTPPPTVGSVPAAHVSRPEAIAEGRNQPTDYSPDPHIPCAWERLRRYHWKASMDNHRPPSMRKWHRGQAEQIRRKLSSPEFRSWSWQRFLAAAQAHVAAARYNHPTGKSKRVPEASSDSDFPWDDLLDAILADIAAERQKTASSPAPLT